MKLIIIHGNGLVSQANKLLQIKKEFDSLAILEIDGGEKDFASVLTEIANLQLFSQKRLVILENFDSPDLSRLPKDENLTVVLRFTKPQSLKSLILKQATNLKAQIIMLNEEEEKNIFPFLDNLAEGNLRALAQLNKLLDQFGSQYLLTMIFYMLRRIILLPKKLPPFIINKLKTQRQLLGIAKIEKLYQMSLETDFKIKSGLMEEKIGLTRLIHQIVTI